MTCLPLKGVLCGRSALGSTFHKAAPQTGGRPPVGEGWTHTGRHSIRMMSRFEEDCVRIGSSPHRHSGARLLKEI